MKRIETKKITKIAVIAALYAVITLLLAPISYGQLQVRISEALTLLPFYLGGWSAIALWIGCMIANYLGPNGLVDVIFGSLITLLAGLLTARAGNKYEAGIYPVLLNAFGISLILYLIADLPYWITVLYIGLGQFISVYIIGLPLMGVLKKSLSIFNNN
ncbi:QueT transporter family protein [Iocasia frigidifontis]|uniref:QueT transporter family protein n=1 Tax=Iocasia fonsfrigidae TaxID=2682810 RepID=A0A8A7K9G9_9FIRM|nr:MULTISPECIES: QueT transporter family protein [Halanaerobiaceae]AZO95586.1 QueT transporter family protein [Halocella sp. SP3-1]QTL98453.1 QueT transporter family protein [Iocasia fonsfrigidae]